MMDFNEKKSDEEFKQPNMICISDDDDAIMTCIK
jgi:hypothetical protein